MNSFDTQRPWRAILFDISVFVLDLLDPEKILKKEEASRDILEIPGALVTMIWTAKADFDRNHRESMVLFQFIYKNLYGIKHNPIHMKSDDFRIKSLANASDDAIKVMAESAYRRLVAEFSPLLEGGPTPPRQAAREKLYKETLTDALPAEDESPAKKGRIRRYDPIVSVDPADLKKIQKAYSRKLGLEPNTLYDLYFLQVRHAQTIGIARSPLLPRTVVAIGRRTFEIIRDWCETPEARWPVSDFSEGDAAYLRTIVLRYFKNEWHRIALGITLDISLSVLLPGAPLGVTTLISAAAMAVTEIGDQQGSGAISKKAFVGIALVIFLAATCYCFALVVEKLIATPGALAIFEIQNTRAAPILPSPSSTATSPAQTATDTPVLPTASPAALPTATASSMPAPRIGGSQAGYCLYVIQPGDSLESIAARFEMPLPELLENDDFLRAGVFFVHQMIRVNRSCCHPSGGRGIDVQVSDTDTIYSLARQHKLPVVYLAAANNLADPAYIQTGQMLCIPEP